MRRIVYFAVLLASAQAQPLSFDVVSVKPAARGDPRAAFESLCVNGGRFVSRGTPLSWEIKWAFGLNDYQLASGPAWLDSYGTYDIEAESDNRATQEQCRVMVQSLFANRFKLKMHAVTKNVPAYALVVAKNGPKFAAGGKVRINGALKQAAFERDAPDGWTMARLANYLSSVRAVGRPVVDRTGLSGSYGFTLEYSMSENDDRPDVFGALQKQLGLKLRPVKAPIGFFMIDHVERPTGN